MGRHARNRTHVDPDRWQIQTGELALSQSVVASWLPSDARWANVGPHGVRTGSLLDRLRLPRSQFALPRILWLDAHHPALSTIRSRLLRGVPAHDRLVRSRADPASDSYGDP